MNTGTCLFESDPIPDAVVNLASGDMNLWDFESVLVESHAHMLIAMPDESKLMTDEHGALIIKPGEPIGMAPTILSDGRTCIDFYSCSEFAKLSPEDPLLPHAALGVPALLDMTRGTLMRMNPGTASEYLLDPDLVARVLDQLDTNGGMGEREVPSPSYAAATHALAGLGNELLRRQRRREYRASRLDPMHQDLCRAAAHGWEVVGWWRDSWPWPKEVADLIDGARNDCLRGFEAALAGDTRLAAYAGRRLMETEFLLMDFALDSRRFDLWKDSSFHLRMKRFSFGESRKRLERARQIPQGFTLPDQPEYQAHTTDVHPSSGAPVEGANDLTLDFLFGVGDLLEHIARVNNALAALADTLDLPAPSADAAHSPEGPLVEVLQKIHGLTKKWGVPDRPESAPRNPDSNTSR